MNIRRAAIGATLSVTVALFAAGRLSVHAAHATGRAKKTILVVTVTKGFRHDSIPVAEETLETLGTQTGASTRKARASARSSMRYDVTLPARTCGRARSRSPTSPA